MKTPGDRYREVLAETLNTILAPGGMLEIRVDERSLLEKLKPAERVSVLSPNELQPAQKFDTVVISDTLNSAEDAVALLEEAARHTKDGGRLVITAHNNLWRPVLTLARWLRLTKGIEGHNWLSKKDIKNLAELAGWEIFWEEGSTLLPWAGPVANRVNRWVAPWIPGLCLVMTCIGRRPKKRRVNSLSILIPTRNEAGTIGGTLGRIPDLSIPTEIIFVEGNSTDSTWDEIEKLPFQDGNRTILKLRQPGKGKGDAVRHGFEHATGDVLTILDGDLTMPPEELPKFIKALESGTTDFANGSRLVYNMEDKAMRLANLVANKFFGLAFTWTLGQPIKDTLCGTKTLWRSDYEKIKENRAFFGDFDPFGDFDLLFGAAKLNLRIRDIPVRYKNRSYGDTNISRWRHGVILLGMLWVAATKLKFR